MDNSGRTLINRNLLLRGGLWGLASRLVSTLGFLTISSILARTIPKEDFGLFLLLFNFTLIIATFNQLGTNSIIIKLLGISLAQAQKTKAKQVVVNALQIVCFFSFISCTALYLVAAHGFTPVLPTNSSNILYGTIAIWAFLRSIQVLLPELMRGLHDLKSASLYSGMITNIFGAALSLILLVIGQTVIPITLTTLLISWTAISCAVVAMAARRLFLTTNAILPKLTGNTSLKKHMLKESLPLWLSSLAVMLVTRSDIIIAGLYLSPEQIGTYAATAQLALLSSLPVAIANNVISPMIPNLIAGNKKAEMQHMLRSITGISTSICLLVSFLYLAIGSDILSLIYGIEYSDGYCILIVLSMGQLIYSWFGSGGYVLAHCGHQKIFTAITISSSVIAIVAAIALTNWLGEIGLALGFVIALAFQTILCAYFSNRLESIRVDASLPPLKLIYKKVRASAGQNT